LSNRNSDCVCGSGLKKKKCHPDLHIESKAALVLNLYKELDELITNYRSKKISSPCRIGCASCCSDTFNISDIEFELILKDIKEKWNLSDLEKLYNKSLETLEWLRVNDPKYYKILEADGTGKIDDTPYLKQIFYGNSRHSACLFLDEKTNSCRIYNIRPLVCRSHGTTHDSNFLYKDDIVCEYIPSTIQNSKVTPDASELIKQGNDIFHIKKENAIIRIREYPIFYWFVIYYRRTGKKDGSILREDENFRFSKTFADNQLMNSQPKMELLSYPSKCLRFYKA